MAHQATQGVSNRKSPIAERVAFDPFLPQQDLINELIRNMINPDTDIGASYYVGQVIGIIDPNDKQIDSRDVFYNSSDNFERATKDVSDKKYNINRVILLVHIPSFITNANEKETSNTLNYNTFTKIRVEHIQDGKVPIKIGNVVKIQFRDKNSFYDPYIIDVDYVSSKKLIEPTNLAKQQFDSYLNCKALQVNFNADLDSINNQSITSPAGGYRQALKELDTIFLPPYINGFLKTVGDEYGDKKNIIIAARKITVCIPVFDAFKGLDSYAYTLEPNQNQDNQYLIRSSEILISSEISTDNLKNAFYNYVKKDMESKMTYTFEPIKGTNDFTVDINMNFILNKPVTNKNVKDYIDVSLKLKDSITYYSPILPAKNTPQTIQKKDMADTCDSKLETQKTIYPLAYKLDNGKSNYGDKVSNPNINILEAFYNNKVDPSSFLQTSYFYQLANIKSSSDLPIGNFYKESGSTNDSYNSTKPNTFLVSELDPNFTRVSNFLMKLRAKIAGNEGLELKDVLIAPRQVLKKKQASTPKTQDDNSRHLYAKAMDISVYLKQTVKETVIIVQVPPEIVMLYCEKIKSNDIFGYGIYLSKKYYNHIEFLDGVSASIADQRFFTGDETPTEKAIEQLQKSTNIRIYKIKEMVTNNNNYKIPGTNLLYPSIEGLVK